MQEKKCIYSHCKNIHVKTHINSKKSDINKLDYNIIFRKMKDLKNKNS